MPNYAYIILIPAVIALGCYATTQTPNPYFGVVFSSICCLMGGFTLGVRYGKYCYRRSQG